MLFPTTTVGSFPKPDYLKKARSQFARGEISEDDPVTTLPAEFVMLGRVFGTLGGLFHHYKPDIDYSEHLMPVIGAAMSERAGTLKSSG